jgi:hypothetical protein
MGKQRALFKLLALWTICAAAAVAHSQLGSGPISDTDANFVALDGTKFTLHDGDTVRYNDQTYSIPKDLKFLETAIPVNKGTTAQGKKIVTVNGKQGVITKREALSFGVYPLTVFSVAGAIQRSSDGAFVGGTYSSTGITYSGDYVQLLDQSRRLEVGGFYYRAFDGSSDLYQVALRFFPTPVAGFQFGYIDSTMFPARTNSYHVLLQTEGRGINGKEGAVHMEFGVGILNNLSPQLNTGTGAYSSLSTVNFSTFVDVSYGLSKNVKLLATEWYVRDRNDDINRFGLGVSFQF